MILAPRPSDDDERLAALAELAILDTDDDPVYDAIVQLAVMITGAPISSITMVDRDRQWHKAMVNIADREAPRETAFCAHTILHEEPLVVEDALRDERFHDNPLVLGRPNIRFYAGARLLAPSGHAVGTLCVIGQEPRALSAAQREGLRALAMQASALLELRLRTRQLEAEVAERTRAEQREREMREAADLANQAKSVFLTRMSHELRTPLNAIIGFSRVLGKNRDCRLGDVELQHLARIERNGHHLLRLINDILDLARVESGQDMHAPEAVELDLLVCETVGELQGRLLAGSSEVALVADVAPGLRPIRSDARRLKQILINLVGNALKFTARGSVTVRAVADGHIPVRIDVIDTGIGIPEDRLEAVFGAFEQATPETAAIYGGTGLGLAISRTLAEALGYRLTVRSAPGAGSTFSVLLEPDAGR